MSDSTTNPDSQPQIDSTRHVVFIVAYIANLALVTANAMTFIFADWVEWLSENSGQPHLEERAGRIIQYGLAAAITARLFLGPSIDRFGVRRVWFFTSSLALCGGLIFLSLDRLSPLLPIGRILYATGLSAMFTCSNFHIQSSVNEQRRTEFIALLGSSGFIGMILGSQLTDLFRWLAQDDEATLFFATFGCATALFAVYLGCVLFVTRGVTPLAAETRPSLITLTRRYWPGLITLVSMMMGLIFVVPSLYLVRFNEHENFGGIATYWTTYAMTAFVFRLKTAALSQRVGRHRLVFVGMLCQGLGLWMLIPVSAWWHLLFSATLCGFGHAFLFPSIVSLGSGTFPAKYRGSGTNLILGCLDLGAALSAPLMGRIIDLPQFDGAGFRQMFFCAGLLPILTAIVWITVHRKTPDTEVNPEPGGSD